MLNQAIAKIKLYERKSAVKTINVSPNAKEFCEQLARYHLMQVHFTIGDSDSCMGSLLQFVEGVVSKQLHTVNSKVAHLYLGPCMGVVLANSKNNIKFSHLNRS